MTNAQNRPTLLKFSDFAGPSGPLDGVVLDPFMGGGSVGIACVESGRGYIGIELSAEYYVISRERIIQAGASH